MAIGRWGAGMSHCNFSVGEGSLVTTKWSTIYAGLIVYLELIVEKTGARAATRFVPGW